MGRVPHKILPDLDPVERAHVLIPDNPSRMKRRIRKAGGVLSLLGPATFVAGMWLSTATTYTLPDDGSLVARTTQVQVSKGKAYQVHEAISVVVAFTTGANVWTVPDDWNNSQNSICCIGAGGGSGGVNTSAKTQGAGGGGGGACSYAENVQLNIGDAWAYTVGARGTAGSSTPTAGGKGGDSYLGGSLADAIIGAQGGFGGGPSSGSPGLGGNPGSSASGVLPVNSINGIKWNGGSGGTGSSLNGGPGGGAASKRGQGQSPVGAKGGNAGTNGAGGANQGSAGVAGVDLDSTHGAGSGAGAPNGAGSGLTGGNYGGGASGAWNSSTGTARTGAQGGLGLIYITYTVSPPFIQAIVPNHGPLAGGTVVEFRGSGFQNSAITTVSIGFVACTNVTINSDTSITATVPAHIAGTVTASIETQHAGTGQLTNAYTYSDAVPSNDFDLNLFIVLRKRGKVCN